MPMKKYDSDSDVYYIYMCIINYIFTFFDMYIYIYIYGYIPVQNRIGFRTKFFNPSRGHHVKLPYQRLKGVMQLRLLGQQVSTATLPSTDGHIISQRKRGPKRSKKSGPSKTAKPFLYSKLLRIYTL